MPWMVELATACARITPGFRNARTAAKAALANANRFITLLLPRIDPTSQTWRRAGGLASCMSTYSPESANSIGSLKLKYCEQLISFGGNASDCEVKMERLRSRRANCVDSTSIQTQRRNKLPRDP